MTKKPFAFVIMPFDVRYEDVYKVGIKATAEAVGIDAERLDEQMYSEDMLDRIFNQIKAADLVIADMSGKNPNVFFEAGYAIAKNKLVIFLADSAENIPFDLKHKRHVVYSSIVDLNQQLHSTLSWAVSEVKRVKESKIRVRR